MPAEVLWPEREPLYDLMLLRATIGAAAFASEKQNDPTDPAACEWPSEYFDWPGFWFDEWPRDLAVRTLAFDPALGKSARGDYPPVVRFGRSREGVEYVEADMHRRPVEARCHDLVAHQQEFRADGVAVESNGFQELVLVPLEQARQAASAEPLPVVLLNNSVDKDVRIRRLGGPLAQRRMRFKARSPGTMLLVQQLRDFPAGDKRDGPDALEMARRLAVELQTGRTRPRHQTYTRVTT